MLALAGREYIKMEDQVKADQIQEKKEKAEDQGNSSPDPTADPYIGYILDGKYQILEQIGSGGWGCVYRGLHLSLDCNIAIKIMHRHLAKDVQGIKRMSQEASILSRLSDLNIVRVLDYGETPAPYIVMEFFEGKQLDTFIKESGPLSCKDAIELFIQLCSGLNNAASLELVHRDLKPSNIILRVKEGELVSKILDFGIAKILDATQDRQRLTETGEIVGSPPYMAPEQWTGICDQRTDIYALGCIMYEAITGKPAFAADSSFQYLNLQASSYPEPISKLFPEQKIPKSLELAILKCMQKKPENRYQSAKDLKADLLKIRDGAIVDIHIKGAAHKDAGSSSKSRQIEYSVVATVVFLCAIASIYTYVRSNFKELPLDERWQTYDLEGQKQFDSGHVKEAQSVFFKELELAESASDRSKIVSSLNEILDTQRYFEDSHGEQTTLARINSLILTESVPYLIQNLEQTLQELRSRKNDGSYTDELRSFARDLCAQANKLAEFIIPGSEPRQGLDLMLQKTAELAELVQGAKSVLFAKCKLNIARDAIKHGKYKLGIDNCQLALKAAQNSDRKDFRLIVQTLLAMGSSYYLLGESELSQKRLDEATEISSKEFGKKSRESASCLLELAQISELRGEKEKAIAYAREAVTIYDLDKGSHEIEKVWAYTTLARLERNPKRYQEALLLAESKERKDYSCLAYNLCQLGKARLASNQKLAEANLRRALVLIEHFDRADQDVAKCDILNAIAQLKKEAGDLDTAEKILKDVLQLRESCFGKLSPDVIATCTDLAVLAAARGQNRIAENRFKEAIALLKEAKTSKNFTAFHGMLEKHEPFKETIQTYTDWLRKQNRQTEAENLLAEWQDLSPETWTSKEAHHSLISP